MASATPHVSNNAGPSTASSARLLVLDVTSTPTEKRIRTVDTVSNKQVLLHLHDEWETSAVSPGFIVRVVLTRPDGSYEQWPDVVTSTKPVHISREQNLLIIHPDTLVSGTAVSDSFLCLRKAVLNFRTPAGNVLDSAGGEAALFGSMIHKLFQKLFAVDSGRRDPLCEPGTSCGAGVELVEVFEIVEDLLVEYLEDLYGAKVSDRHARQVLHKIIPEMLQWYNDFMGAGDPNAAVGVPVRDNTESHSLVITDVHDIEELIWSPVLGLKGKIDATVHFRVDGVDSGVGIFELKTGSSMGYSGVSHAAQVALYNLLMSDRYDQHVNHGLISYVRYQEALKAVREDEERSNSTGDRIGLSQTPASFDQGAKNKSVRPTRSEVVGLIMQRNSLASYLRFDASVKHLPPTIKGRENLCAKCFASDNCLIQHKLLENGSSQSVQDGPGVDLYQRKAGHLNLLHAAYYSFWRKVLAGEEEHAGKFQKEIWTMRGAKREALGRCFSNLTLVPEENHSEKTTLLPPGERLSTTFRRQPDGPLQGNFLNSRVSKGEYVIVSAEGILCGDGWRGRPSAMETWKSGLANGFVENVTATAISVTIDRDLMVWARHQGLEASKIAWRVDAEEIYASHNTAKRTLETLFTCTETADVTRLRELIVDRKAPAFKDDDGSDPGALIQKNFGLNLNEDQQHALRMSLRAKDYVLVLGMPGTGKTTTLAAVVLATAARGQTVLLCSHTNAAVDNLLGRLLDVGFADFVRLGRNIRVIDSRIHPFHVSKKFAPGQTLSELETALNSPRVVATTCLGINHPVLARRGKFDLVVVDEASQILQPICVGPLQFADGPFILVGDHYQLPPLLRAIPPSHSSPQKRSRDASVKLRLNDENEEISLGNVSSTNESLFRRLCEVHPEAMITLSKQYRMAAEIMGLSNELVYSGSLSCGSDSVASQRLGIGLDGLRNLSPWLKAVRNPSRRLVFIDCNAANRSGDGNHDLNQSTTNNTTAGDDSSRDSSTEAAIVLSALKTLVQGGMAPEDITVLSPFRAQVHLIKDQIAGSSDADGIAIQGVDAFTVDQYQGKDNKCIIISFVRSHSQTVGPLLRDWRRINVALTRAKQKLVLVGSAKTLSKGGHLLGRMVEYLRARKLIFPVAGS